MTIKSSKIAWPDADRAAKPQNQERREQLAGDLGAGAAHGTLLRTPTPPRLSQPRLGLDTVSEENLMVLSWWLPGEQRLCSALDISLPKRIRINWRKFREEDKNKEEAEGIDSEEAIKELKIRRARFSDS